MVCIFVAGLPGAGKTTLSNALAQRLEIPMMSIDPIKEKLYKSLGFRSRQERDALDKMSLGILTQFAESAMKAQEDFLLDGNFEEASKENLLPLLQEYQYIPITLYLTGDIETIYDRFVDRHYSYTRHPGHVVDCYPPAERNPVFPPPISYEEYCKTIRQKGILGFHMGGRRLEIDVTDLRKLNIEKIAQQIQQIRDEKVNLSQSLGIIGGSFSRIF